MKKTTKATKTTPAVKDFSFEPAATTTYQGAPIPAVKVFRRDMPEFKNCKAECWMIIGVETYTFANTYNDQLKSSYDPKHYSYPLNEKSQKKVDKKAETMVEIEATDWPQWVTQAATKKTRKSSK